MVFTVYQNQAAKAVKRLDKIARKAEKYGVPFSYSIGPVHPAPVSVYHVDHEMHKQDCVAVYNVAAVDIDVECDALIRADGWTVCAKIEHGENGKNIVVPFGSVEIDRKWYTAPARCDHCGTVRNRAYTFLCRNAAGEIKQVGRSCLKDYTGIAPEIALLFALVRDVFDDDRDGITDDEFTGRGFARMYEAADVIALAVDAVTRYGYRKADSINSTKDIVLNTLNKEPSAEAKEKAARIVDWLAGRGEKAAADDAMLAALEKKAIGHDDDYVQHWVEDDDALREWNKAKEKVYRAWDSVSDLERNCAALCAGGYVRDRHVGMLSYMPVAYDKFMERKAAAEAREADRAAQAEQSAYVGTVGERITFKIGTALLVTSWETEYGYTYLYKITDAAGNVFIWYASSGQNIKSGATIKGTVKDHKDRDGVKQTIITRCRVSG